MSETKETKKVIPGGGLSRKTKSQLIEVILRKDDIETELKKKVHDLEVAKNTNEKQLSEVREFNITLTNKINELESSNAKLSNKCDDLSLKNLELSKENNTLESKCSAFAIAEEKTRLSINSVVKGTKVLLATTIIFFATTILFMIF